MQKIVAWIGVLMLASVASANVSFGIVDDSDPYAVQVGVYSDDDATYVVWVEGLADGVEFDKNGDNQFDADDGILIHPAAGPLASDAGYGASYLKLSTDAQGNTPTEGLHFSLLIDASSGPITLNIRDEDFGEFLDTIDVTPEPIVMSLLGLGGLLAVRRRA